MLKGVSLAAAVCLLAVLQPAHAQRNLTVAAPPASEQRVALVIGNGAYVDAPLKNPANDATDVALALREVGFQVTLRTNARQRDMKQAIREFGEALARGGVGVFYFAGHGIQSKGRNFLVPVGAQIERESHIEDETVDANFVLAQMEDARNRLNIVILDACRNNPYSRSFRSASRGLAQMDATSGTLIAFATAPGSVAADGDGRNGVYTRHLLRQMREPGLPVELMLKRVRDGVITETKERQVPWESSSLRGADFYFRPALQQPGALAALSPALSADNLQRARSQVRKGTELLLQGRDRAADEEFRPAFEVLRHYQPADLDDETRAALGRLQSRIGRNYAAALEILLPLAEKGDAMAQNTVGLLYREGVGVVKDEKAALHWLRRSAAQGNVFAQNNLGFMYMDGRGGVAKDEREGVAWHRKAAAQGYPPAQNALGVWYRDGRGVDKDEAEAAIWLRKAAEAGNPLAQYSLGILYRDGRGVAKDAKQAVALFRKSAEQGHHHAQANLGIMYERGSGVAKDEREAQAWFEKAAAQGNPTALARLKPRQ